MQSFKIDTCEHGIPVSVHCSKCKPSDDQVEEITHCKHDRDTEHCWECREAEDRKVRLLELLNDPTESLRQSIPAKYLKSSFSTFQNNEKLIKECREYKDGGLVLYGNTGCGKTHLAVSILRNLYENNLRKSLESNDGYWIPLPVGVTMRFKPVPDLLMEIRSSFQENAVKTEEQIIHEYATIPFLILDDLGSEKTSEFSITTLYIIIDRRDRELMPTVITTNLNNKEIEDKLGARIASRLAGMKNIKINMPDWRKKR